MSSETRTLRPAAQRPTVAQLVGRTLSITVVVAVALLGDLPGVRLDSFWAALLVALIATVIATLLATALALDDAWYDERMARLARRRRRTATTDVPGVVFVQTLL
jgi:ABC-type spermidine/putrescine transport system permease subunit II